MTTLSRAADTSDFRAAAKRRLPNILFEYIDGGSYGEETLRRNVADFTALTLRQRVMRDMSLLSMRVSVFGQELAMPVGLSPVGLSGMYARRGEVQGAQAAAAAGIPFCLSTVGICSIEEVARGGKPPWFQLYILKDRGYMRELLRRAKAVACPVLILTADLPIPGARYRDVRSGFRGTTGVRSFAIRAWDGVTHPRWLWDVWLRGRPHTLGTIAAAMGTGDSPADFLGWIARNFDRTVTWRDLEWIRSEWPGPIVIKGIMDRRDAKEALRAGAQGVVVSNHGARQLDGVRSSISALAPIVDAVGDDMQIFLDGGVRSGLDVLKAISLGAKCCFLGRAWAYALGAGGREGVTKMLDTVRSELEVAMVLTGCQRAGDAGRELLDDGNP